MIVSIFRKYGVVPKEAMPEVQASSNSTELNKYINKKLRKDAMVLRSLVAKGAGDQEILETRRTLMKEVYDILSIALGSPVKKFDFKYRDRDKEYHVDTEM